MRAPQAPCERDVIRQGHTAGGPMPRAMGAAAHAAAAIPEPPPAGAARAKAVDDRQPSDAPLRHLLDTLPILASCHRPDGSTAFCNQRWQDYTGLSMAQAHGWGWHAPIHPDDLGTLMETWSQLLASGEPGEADARLRRVDGAYRWCLLRAVPVRDELGHLVHWSGTTPTANCSAEAPCRGARPCWRGRHTCSRGSPTARRSPHPGHHLPDGRGAVPRPAGLSVVAGCTRHPPAARRGTPPAARVPRRPRRRRHGPDRGFVPRRRVPRRAGGGL